MKRLNLVTKEKVKKAAEEKLKNEKDWKYLEGSINDDLELEAEHVFSFFTPKLTIEELKLVQEGNEEHLRIILMA